MEVVGAASANPANTRDRQPWGFGPSQVEFVKTTMALPVNGSRFISAVTTWAVLPVPGILYQWYRAGNLYGNVKGFEVRNGAA